MEAAGVAKAQPGAGKRFGTLPERIGNRDEFMVPSGTYRCAPDEGALGPAGDDAWVALAVGSPEEWAALASAIIFIVRISYPVCLVVTYIQ